MARGNTRQTGTTGGLPSGGYRMITAAGAVVTLTNGDGEVTREQVAFNDENTTQSLSIGVSLPSLSTSTVGTYARSFGEKSLLLPLLYGMLWLLFVPAAGGVLIMSSLGLLVGAIGSVVWALNAASLAAPGQWLVNQLS